MEPTPGPGSPDPVKPAKPPKPPVLPGKRIIPPRPLLSIIVVAGFTGALYVIEAIDVALQHRLDYHGIYPREIDQWDGIIWAPLLHGGWDHLIANSGPLLVLALLASSGGMRQFLGVTTIIWLVGGVGTFLIGSTGVHIGASGLVFGYLAFVLVRGLFALSIPQIVIAVGVFFAYGWALWGVLPSQPGVSWEGHLSGAIGGILAAWMVGKSIWEARKQAKAAPSLYG